MSDEFDAIINEVTNDQPIVEPKGPARSNPSADDRNSHPETFDDSAYENENDANFDPDSVPIEERKKMWPKKYVNAFERYKQEKVKALSDLAVAQKRIADFERAQQQNAPAAANNGANGANPANGNQLQYTADDQARVKAVEDKKPDVKDFKTWEEYQEKLTEWQYDLRDIHKEITNEAKQKADKQTNEAAAATAAVEERIARQAKQVVEQNPQFVELLVANMDLIEALPENIATLLGNIERPELATIALMQHDGALQALAKMNPVQAANYIARAEIIGHQIIANSGNGQADASAQQQRPQQTRPASNAPVPMRSAKAIASGGKPSLDKLSDAELFQELGID